MSSMIERLRAEAAAKRAQADSEAQAVPAAATEQVPATSLAAKLAALKNKTAGMTGQGSIVSSAKSTIADKLRIATLENASGKSAAELGAEALAKLQVKKEDDAFERATSILQRRRDSGLYTIPENVAERMPEELPADVLEAKLAHLDAALLTKTPEMRGLMMDLAKNLRQYEELVHLLSDEQLNIITSGLMDVAGVEVVSSKKTAGSAAAISAGASLTVDDFGF